MRDLLYSQEFLMYCLNKPCPGGNDMYLNIRAILTIEDLIPYCHHLNEGKYNAQSKKQVSNPPKPPSGNLPHQCRDSQTIMKKKFTNGDCHTS